MKTATHLLSRRRFSQSFTLSDTDASAAFGVFHAVLETMAPIQLYLFLNYAGPCKKLH